jgi:hypothetical protein
MTEVIKVEETKKIRIVSDGTVAGTRVIDCSGELIPLVNRLEISINNDTDLVIAKMELVVDLDLECEAKVSKVTLEDIIKEEKEK